MPDKNFKRKNFREKREESEFDQQLVDIARVTRVVAGGKRMRFRACLVVGDHRGRVGIGLAKGKDVPVAIQKAYRKAEKNVMRVNITDGTIPHEVTGKWGAARVFLKPAPAGTGVIAGGSCRIVLNMAGIHNVVAKMLGANNKVNNIQATLLALGKLKKVASKKDKAVSGEPKEIKIKPAKEEILTEKK